MKRKMLALAAAVILVTLAIIPATSLAWEWMYVYTDNGKSLNVREQPSTGSRVMTRVKYGEKIAVDHYLSNGWAEVYVGSQDVGYVMTRYLTASKPAAKPTPRPTVRPTAAPAKASDLEAMNNEFRSFRQVATYTVAARPTRASGWVNLRFAPSMSAHVFRTLQADYQLYVLGETTNWLMVQDPMTNMVGYVSKNYMTVVR